jgi:N-acetylglutamate synthase-like GNAT family acetyltransferase
MNKNINKKDKNLEVKIVKYTPELSKYFYSINAQWVNDMFYMEEYDEKILSNPQKYIINEGGQIWFAIHKELGVIGTCAVKNFGENWYELTKMGVIDSARGLKAGEVLLKQVIKDTLTWDVDTLFLLTSSKCEAAIHLYEKNGFMHDESIKEKFKELYERSDTFMKYIG